MSANIDDFDAGLTMHASKLRLQDETGVAGFILRARDRISEQDAEIVRLNGLVRDGLESAERAERYRLKTLEQDAEITRLRAALEKVRAETFYGGSSGYYHMSKDAYQAVVAALKGDA